MRLAGQKAFHFLPNFCTLLKPVHSVSEDVFLRPHTGGVLLRWICVRRVRCRYFCLTDISVWMELKMRNQKTSILRNKAARVSTEIVFCRLVHNTVDIISVREESSSFAFPVVGAMCSDFCSSEPIRIGLHVHFRHCTAVLNTTCKSESKNVGYLKSWKSFATVSNSSCILEVDSFLSCFLRLNVINVLPFNYDFGFNCQQAMRFVIDLMWIVLSVFVIVSADNRNLRLLLSQYLVSWRDLSLHLLFC